MSGSPKGLTAVEFYPSTALRQALSKIAKGGGPSSDWGTGLEYFRSFSRTQYSFSYNRTLLYQQLINGAWVLSRQGSTLAGGICFHATSDPCGAFSAL